MCICVHLLATHPESKVFFSCMATRCHLFPVALSASRFFSIFSKIDVPKPSTISTGFGGVGGVLKLRNAR